MSAWGDMRKRSSGEVLRKEDIVYFWSCGEKNPFKGVLDSGTEKILSEIHSFGGFAPFLPANILLHDGKVKVFLDDKESRTVSVPLKKLEEERDSLKEEVEYLKNLLEELVKTSNVDQREIEKLREKIRKLTEKIGAIEDIIKEKKDAGEDSVELIAQLLGKYVRENAEIHLMMGTIEEDYRSKGLVAKMTAIVLVHELMHAYFDVLRDPYVEHPHCRSIEEPIAEYGMLCFMEMFERCYSGYAGILNTAKEMVEEKKYSLGVCDYGFGNYLFEDRARFGVDWVSLFHSTCSSLLMNAPEVIDYGGMVSPIKYPHYERSCEWKLFEVLKSKRFVFKGSKTDWGHIGKANQELYFHIGDTVANDIHFRIEYPPKTTIQLTFHDNTNTKVISGLAAVQVQDRFRLRVSLMRDFDVAFKTTERYFAFYEEKPSDGIHPAEWIAIEL